MAKETKNLGLYIEDSAEIKFQDWRNRINGPEGSNMEKIDAAFGNIAALLDSINGEVA